MIAIETSDHFQTPIQIFQNLLPIRIVALNESLLHHVVTLVTLLISSSFSSNSFFGLPRDIRGTVKK
ncbi:hypothetical protein GW750_07995 [bacterium]|nr:hypothetical protein [bacterium]